MNRDITVSDVRIILCQIEVSCIVSSNYVQRVVIFFLYWTLIYHEILFYLLLKCEY